jgi:hypothetical protein
MPELTKIQPGFIGDTPSTDYPSVPPSLDLNFARTKVLDPRINFTRESSGSFVDSRGFIQIAPSNAPRFEHDANTGECLGLLIEETRTNIIRYSENFSQWSYTNASGTANATLSPSGNVDAYALVENTTAGVGHYLSLSGNVLSASTTYTFSAFIKRNGRDVALQINNGNSPLHVGMFTWNLATATFVGYADIPGYPGFTSTGGTITPYPNGWYRITATFTTGTSATGGTTFYIEATDNVSVPHNSTPLYTGNGTSGFYLWGVQVEQGFVASSYIPTYYGYSTTRNLDYANIIGTNFTNFYNQYEGTFYTEFMSRFTTTISAAGFVSNNKSLSEYVDVSRLLSNNIASGYVTNTTTQSAILINIANSYNTFYKTAHGFKDNDFMFYVNGTGGTPDTSGTLPKTMNMLEIGGGLNSGSYQLNGCIKRILYYPRRITNSQLQNLTS